MPEKEKFGFNGSLKEREGYLKQIANNSDEKINGVATALVNGELPKNTEGKIRILELGPGGGESIVALNKVLKEFPEVQLTAADISPGILDRLKERYGIDTVVTDATELPFENTFSAINVSAVLHEVSSYGKYGDEGEERITGIKAIEQAIRSFHRALLPGGMLTYRDVSCPERKSERLEVLYRGESWYFFLKWFLEDFEDAYSNVFSEKYNVEVKHEKENTNIIASRHFHRELQRHYIMFRDYLRNQLNDRIGLSVIEELWKEKEEGIKVHSFKAEGTLLACIDPSLRTEDNIYRMESVQYDALFDRVITEILLEEGELYESLEVEIADWKKREGREIYTYATAQEMIDLVANTTFEVGDGYLLIPKSNTATLLCGRAYYNRYLREVIDQPEFDGKQIISFQKVTYEEALGIIERENLKISAKIKEKLGK